MKFEDLFVNRKEVEKKKKLFERAMREKWSYEKFKGERQKLK